jgi:phosphoglycolate phosphatase-like HAD superfamily hydrolase
MDTAYVGDAATDLQCADTAGALGFHAAWGPARGNTGRSAGRHLTAASPAHLAQLVAKVRRDPRV